MNRLCLLLSLAAAPIAAAQEIKPADVTEATVRQRPRDVVRLIHDTPGRQWKDTPAAKHKLVLAGDTVLWWLKTTRPIDGDVTATLSEGDPLTLLPAGEDRTEFVGVRTFPEFVERDYEVNFGDRKLEGTFRTEHYELSPDSFPKDGVPTGIVTRMPDWDDSKAYPGTTRQWWVYVPAQYDEAEGACVMVWQDGQGYLRGPGAVPVVMDNLIHQGKMPPTIAVFVNPGVFLREGQEPRRNRSVEYDVCTPTYAKFLETEILAEVQKKYRLKDDPMCRAIAGASSGGSCAFTAAWHRPDLFGRVLSQIGSFCDFRSIGDYPNLDGTNAPSIDKPRTFMVAHTYPPLIRKVRPIKPLRVFLQDGSNDLNNQLGNWPLNNRRMAKALQYSGYPYRFVMGKGFHSREHGTAILPESLTWLWSDGPAEDAP